jgi:hypothetical protein
MKAELMIEALNMTVTLSKKYYPVSGDMRSMAEIHKDVIKL